MIGEITKKIEEKLLSALDLGLLHTFTNQRPDHENRVAYKQKKCTSVNL